MVEKKYLVKKILVQKTSDSKKFKIQKVFDSELINWVWKNLTQNDFRF